MSGKGIFNRSNVIIGYLDNKLPVQAMKTMNSIIDDKPNISIITKIEILRFNTSEINYKILKDFIDESIVFGLDDLVTDHTISICRSNRIKLPDAIIAATAIVYDLRLVTRNITDFKKIKDIELLNPWDIS